MSDDFALVAAGSTIPDAYDHIRRYCGIRRGSDVREVWGYEFFDALRSPAVDEVTADDVAATAALGIRFTQQALQGFVEARVPIQEVLKGIPTDLSLEDATDRHLDLIEEVISGLSEGRAHIPKVPGAGRAQVSKVLHRKRPRLIPLYDRVIAERYAFGLGDKQFARGRDLSAAIRDDLNLPENGRVLRRIQGALATELDGGAIPSRLRLLDIAIWMEGMPKAHADS